MIPSLSWKFLRSVVFALVCLGASAFAAVSNRERIRFDDGWRFALGHATDPAKDFNHATGFFSYLAKTGFGDGPANSAFDDRAWREVNVPHDWAVEMPFDSKASHSHGYKAVGPRFPENSVGWYRKHFEIPQEDLGRRIRLDFDGVFRNARVFVNGFFVGEEPSGYLPASYDVTDYLNYGGDNVVVVRADASMEEGWFYEGAGIYRHVWLVKTSPVHVENDGTWVRTEIAGGVAQVIIDTTVVNEGRTVADVQIDYLVDDPSVKPVGRGRTPVKYLAPGARETVTVTVEIPTPRLWSLAKPQLYSLKTAVVTGGQRVDFTDTRFGLRKIRFDPDQGFFLNGEHVVLKGTNNHQDHAGVGAAIPDALQEFRLRQLKEMGANAYRCSHNPPTPELLDLCDRLGVLVIDETRLMGSNVHHLSQLERMIKRDRNHPSVILWSLGNEEWAIESNTFGARITTTMQDFATRLDPTRLNTVAISGGWGGSSTTVGVAGVNYIKQGDTDKQHAQFPQQIIVGTEETTTQQTRGIYFDDRARGYLAPQEDGSSGFNAEIGWQHYVARPYAAGVFYWTGFDYRGEPTPFGYPSISSQFGILDTCGFPKDGYSYLKSWWTDEPVLHLFPHWNWPDRVGQTIEVRAHSNCDEVELFLNGASLGRKAMPRNGHLAWKVNYAPGVLEAHGYRGGQEILRDKVETTGAAAAVKLTPAKDLIFADGRDLSIVTVAIHDPQGRVVPTANVPVSFRLEGPGKIIGVGNGDPSSHEPDVFVGSSATFPVGTWKAPDAAPSTAPIVFEANFDLPEGSEGQVVDLLLNALGPKQTVTLNGRELLRDAPPEKSRTMLRLDSSMVRPRGNVIRFESNRFESWRGREALQFFAPATLRITKPAGYWRRSTFNGLAQVIVQSVGGKPGSIVLTATAEKLSPAKITIEAR